MPISAASPTTGSASRAGSPSRWCARDGATHYDPISWDDAFALIARELRANASPDEAAFYTSGRTSNEAAFLYQLFARAYGTNNLPDCSNMCHESSGVALTASIGVGKGSVSLDDIHDAKLLVIVGQNPGTNHPRMLTALENAKKRGARIIAVNPLPEAGLMRFRNPQTVRGRGRPAARRWPTRTCRSGSAATSRCSRRSARCCSQWGAVDQAFVDAVTPPDSTPTRAAREHARLGRRRSPRPG